MELYLVSAMLVSEADLCLNPRAIIALSVALQLAQADAMTAIVRDLSQKVLTQASANADMEYAVIIVIDLWHVGEDYLPFMAFIVARLRFSPSRRVRRTALCPNRRRKSPGGICSIFSRSSAMNSGEGANSGIVVATAFAL